MLRLRVEGPPGPRFTEVIRQLPDGPSWMVSDAKGAVVIARSEGDLVREAIFSAGEDGVWEVECLASRGVSEIAVQGLVAASLLVCIAALVGVWWLGFRGVSGLIVGVVAAGSLPAMVLAIGQRLLDPGREAGAEANLERALRFSVAQVRGADLINTDG